MIKLLIGGSPCTHWSIAQTVNRETKPEGIGWELFKNYLIAKEKFKPDFFLYENNKSAADSIKNMIKKELGVTDGMQYDLFQEDIGSRYIEINSALVSAQNRERFYVHNCGEVQQPEDRGILLRDILEYGVTDKQKAYCLKHQAGNARDYFKKHHTNVSFFPVQVGALPRPNGELSTSQAMRVYNTEGKSVTLSAGGGGMGGKTGLYAIPVNDSFGKARTLKHQHDKNNETNFIGDRFHYTGVGEPVIFSNPHGFNKGGAKYVKAPTLTATGKYVYNNGILEPVCYGCECGYAIACEFDADGNPTMATSPTDGKPRKVFLVTGGQIELHGKNYPISLPDGYWIIRKLTVTECCRLQTLPDDYCRAVSDTQALKAIGNGWTAEVIIHILNGALKDVPRDEKILVLSMYDGIATGRYCLDRMGFTNVEYHAYEIDKYAIKVALSNYPDIVQHGDAFSLREEGWKI